MIGDNKNIFPFNRSSATTVTGPVNPGGVPVNFTSDAVLLAGEISYGFEISRSVIPIGRPSDTASKFTPRVINAAFAPAISPANNRSVDNSTSVIVVCVRNNPNGFTFTSVTLTYIDGTTPVMRFPTNGNPPKYASGANPKCECSATRCDNNRSLRAAIAVSTTHIATNTPTNTAVSTTTVRRRSFITPQ